MPCCRCQLGRARLVSHMCVPHAAAADRVAPVVLCGSLLLQRLVHRQLELHPLRRHCRGHAAGRGECKAERAACGWAGCLHAERRRVCAGLPFSPAGCGQTEWTCLLCFPELSALLVTATWGLHQLQLSVILCSQCRHACASKSLPRRSSAIWSGPGCSFVILCSQSRHVPSNYRSQVISDVAWDLQGFVGWSVPLGGIVVAFRGTDSHSIYNWWVRQLN